MKTVIEVMDFLLRTVAMFAYITALYAFCYYGFTPKGAATYFAMTGITTHVVAMILLLKYYRSRHERPITRQTTR